MRIAERYRDLLEISEDDGIVSFPVTVENVRRPQVSGIPAHRAGGAGARDAAVPDVLPPGSGHPSRPRRASLWNLETFNRRGRDFLAFAATPWNAGPAPLVVEGFRRPGEELMDAYQYFRDADGLVVGRAPVEATCATTRIRPTTTALPPVRAVHPARCRRPRGRAQPKAGLLPGSHRRHRPHGRARELGTGSRPLDRLRRPRRALGAGGRQAGWGDTYFQFVPGQSFNITSLPNGWYRPDHVNPLGSLYETDMSNNVESRLLHLGGRPGARRVLVAPWHGIDA